MVLEKYRWLNSLKERQSMECKMFHDGMVGLSSRAEQEGIGLALA